MLKVKGCTFYTEKYINSGQLGATTCESNALCFFKFSSNLFEKKNIEKTSIKVEPFSKN